MGMHEARPLHRGRSVGRSMWTAPRVHWRRAQTEGFSRRDSTSQRFVSEADTHETMLSAPEAQQSWTPTPSARRSMRVSSLKERSEMHMVESLLTSSAM